jgi:tRNA threonylcarbamoyladenosine biosynthesis protein TsaB
LKRRDIMHLLAFDTSTDALSVAVMRSTPTGPRYWQHQGAGGAAASGSLIATIMDLLRQADLRVQDLDAICFGSGPGSFTGLRTACAVAQGLAYGAGVPVLPVPSLLALAQTARAAHAPEVTQGSVIALLDARMDEVYAASYAFAGDVWTTLQSPCLLVPEQVAVWSQFAAALQPESANARHRPVAETARVKGEDSAPLLSPTQVGKANQASLHWRAWAGNVFATYGERLAVPATVMCCDALPQALAILQVAPVLIKAGACMPPEQALPLYVRDKVAKTTGERALEKAAKVGIAPSVAASAALAIAPAAAHAQTTGS